MDAFTLDDVVAVEGAFPVLAGVTVSARTGTLTAIIGGNGAGKTSLLRTIAGLTSLARGTGEVLGCNLATNASGLIGRVGLLSHATGLYDELSPIDNLRFLARVTRANRQAVDAALALVSLSERAATTPVGQLSAGQRRRAGLSALVLRSPELWLLDEPHASLDPEAKATVDRLIASVVKAGATVVLTSHEPERAAQSADQVVHMAGGAVVTVEAGSGQVHHVS